MEKFEQFVNGVEKLFGVHLLFIAALYAILGVWQMGIAVTLMGVSLLLPRSWLLAPWGKYYCFVLAAVLTSVTASEIVPVLPWHEQNVQVQDSLKPIEFQGDNGAD